MPSCHRAIVQAVTYSTARERGTYIQQYLRASASVGDCSAFKSLRRSKPTAPQRKPARLTMTQCIPDVAFCIHPCNSLPPQSHARSHLHPQSHSLPSHRYSKPQHVRPTHTQYSTTNTYNAITALPAPYAHTSRSQTTGHPLPSPLRASRSHSAPHPARSSPRTLPSPPKARPKPAAPRPSD